MISTRGRAAGLLVGGLVLLAPGCAPVAPTPAAGEVPRVLIVGGGTSHDYSRWLQQADSATLATAGARVRYTDAPGEILPGLAGTDVLYLSNNQPLSDPQLREGIFGHVGAGKGLIIGHAASWYNWKDWPAYNRELVGGGRGGTPGTASSRWRWWLPSTRSCGACPRRSPFGTSCTGSSRIRRRSG